MHPETGALLERGTALVVVDIQGKRISLPMDGWFDPDGGDSLHTGRDLWANDLAVRLLRDRPTDHGKANGLLGVVWGDWMDQLFDAPPVRSAHPVALCAPCAHTTPTAPVLGVDSDGKVASVGCGHPRDPSASNTACPRGPAAANTLPVAPIATTVGPTRSCRRG